MKIRNQKITALLMSTLMGFIGFAQANEEAELILSVIINNQPLMPSITLFDLDNTDGNGDLIEITGAEVSFGTINVDVPASHYRVISQNIRAVVEHSVGADMQWEVRIYTDDEFSRPLPPVIIGNPTSVRNYEDAIANNLFLKTGIPDDDESNLPLKVLIKQTVINVGADGSGDVFPGPQYNNETTGLDETPDFTNNDHWNDGEVFRSVFDVTTTGRDGDTYVSFFRTLTDEPSTREGKTHIDFQLAVDGSNASSSISPINYGRTLVVEFVIEPIPNE